MKSKNYWEKTTPAEGDPFGIPKRLSKGLVELARKHDAASPSPVVEYLWIYVTDEGLRRRADECGCALNLDEWLNVIDESASLGADWMVVYVGASLCQCPQIWKMCRWAQNEYGMRVGLHLSSAALSEDDIERLTQLDLERTYLVADRALIDSLRPLRDRGVKLVEANLHEDDRNTRCTNPESIACVGIDGRLYTCGLVLGEKEYDLGNVLARGLKEVLQDAGLPHAVPDTASYPTNGCDGCPPHMARRILQTLPK